MTTVILLRPFRDEDFPPVRLTLLVAWTALIVIVLGSLLMAVEIFRPMIAEIDKEAASAEETDASVP